MKNIKAWFINLSRIGKLSVFATLALGGIFFTSASTPPTQEVNTIKSEPILTTKTETETVSIPYSKSTKEDSSLTKGESQIATEGVNGEKVITHTITLTNGVETGRTSEERVTKEPVEEVTLLGTYVAPRYVAPAPRTQSSCDPNYSGGCVPNVSYDLNCKDISFSVTVVGYDKHGFDRDGDGYGCESN